MSDKYILVSMSSLRLYDSIAQAKAARTEKEKQRYMDVYCVEGVDTLPSETEKEAA